MNVKSQDPRNFNGFDAICRLASEKLNVNRSVISVVYGGQLHSLGHTFGADNVPNRHRDLATSICSHTMQNGAPLVIRDASKVDWLGDTEGVTRGNVKAYLGVPVVIAGEGIVGAMCVIDENPRLWSDMDTENLQALADLAASRVHRDLLRIECDALSRVADETDRILMMLARSRSAAVTVHDEAGQVLFANDAFRTRVRDAAMGMPLLPGWRIAQAARSGDAGRIDVILDLVGAGPTRVPASLVTDQGGTIMLNWWFPDMAGMDAGPNPVTPEQST